MALADDPVNGVDNDGLPRKPSADRSDKARHLGGAIDYGISVLSYEPGQSKKGLEIPIAQRQHRREINPVIADALLQGGLFRSLILFARDIYAKALGFEEG